MFLSSSFTKQAYDNQSESSITMKLDITIEGLAKALGMFAAYFALYESYLFCFQPNGSAKLEEELGDYFEWFFRHNNLYALIPANEVSTTSEKAQFVAVLQLAAALPVVVMRNKLYGLCLLSWFYMVAVRGHLMLKTPYVPVVLTMFGFSHVALVTHLLSGFFSGSSETETTQDEDGSPSTPTAEDIKPSEGTKTTQGGSKKKSSKKKSKSS